MNKVWLILLVGLLSISLVGALEATMNPWTGKLDYINAFNLTNEHKHDALNLTNVAALNDGIILNTDNLTNVAGLNNEITIQGENISGGTILFARLPVLTDTHTLNALNITSLSGLDDKITLKSSNVTTSRNLDMLAYNITWTAGGYIYDNGSSLILGHT